MQAPGRGRACDIQAQAFKMQLIHLQSRLCRLFKSICRMSTQAWPGLEPAHTPLPVVVSSSGLPSSIDRALATFSRPVVFVLPDSAGILSTEFKMAFLQSVTLNQNVCSKRRLVVGSTDDSTVLPCLLRPYWHCAHAALGLPERLWECWVGQRTSRHLANACGYN